MQADFIWLDKWRYFLVANNWLFDFLVAHNPVILAPWMGNSGALIAFNEPPVFIHGAHTTTSYANRISNSVSFCIFHWSIKKNPCNFWTISYKNVTVISNRHALPKTETASKQKTIMITLYVVAINRSGLFTYLFVCFLGQKVPFFVHNNYVWQMCRK